jgi:hypothetical protein
MDYAWTGGPNRFGPDPLAAANSNIRSISLTQAGVTR